MKRLTYSVLATAVLAAVGLAASVHSSNLNAASALGGDPANATYAIEGETFQLVDGIATRPSAPGSASKTEVRLLGDAARGDLDGDGMDDAAVWLTMQSGGSGSYYYVAAALKRSGGFQGSKAVFIGDRIAPGRLTIRNGAVIVVYADRGPNEAFSVAPTIQKTRVLTLKQGGLAPADGR